MGDLADVSPVIRIQLIACSVVKGLKRAECAAELRTRIDASVGGGGYGKLRQADAAACVAERIARDDPRRSGRHDFDLRRTRWLDVVLHPADQLLGGRVRHEVQRDPGKRRKITVGS